MNPIVEFFIFPISPILALIGTALGLLVLEFFTNHDLRKVKSVLAFSGAVASAFFCLWLMQKGFPTQPFTGQDAWLIEFLKSYRMDSISLALYAMISIFTVFTLTFVQHQFMDSDIFGEILILLFIVAAGMMLLVSAGSLLMVFMALELLSLPTYVLVGIHRRTRYSSEAALKYFLFGSLATVLLVFSFALFYAEFLTLSIPAIHNAILAKQGALSLGGYLGLGMLIIAVGFKVGAVPFHMWLPDAYQGAPTSITGFMGSAIKLAAFGLCIRVFWEMLAPIANQWTHLLAWIAIITSFVGNLAALVQDNLKRLFAYSSIAHAGYLLLGIAAFGDNTSFLPVYYYLSIYGLTFLGLFGIIYLLEIKNKSVDIFQLSGMGYSQPFLGVCLAFFALSMAGLPPTAGFMAKYFLFFQAFKNGYGMFVVLALITSLIGVYYYLRILVFLYMKESERTVNWVAPKTIMAGVGALALLTLFYAFRPFAAGF